MAEIHDSKSIMKFFSNKINHIAYVILAVFAFYINYFFSNIGVYPIDTFSFFDSGYLITEGFHPIKDFWVISGVLIDYIQGLFFHIFGFLLTRDRPEELGGFQKNAQKNSQNTSKYP